MQCPQCRAENRDEARFCRECGATFSSACPSCGAKIEPAAGSVMAAQRRWLRFSAHYQAVALSFPESYTLRPVRASLSPGT